MELTARARGGPRRTSCSCQSNGLHPAPSSPYSPKPEGKSPQNARSQPRQPPSPMGPPHASPDPAVLQPSSSACHPDISPFRLLTRHLGLGLWHPANRETAAESFRPDSKALFLEFERSGTKSISPQLPFPSSPTLPLLVSPARYRSPAGHDAARDRHRRPVGGH